MTKYKCGHECETIIANTNVDILISWLSWKDSVGFDGDRSKCWDCYCKDI